MILQSGIPSLMNLIPRNEFVNAWNYKLEYLCILLYAILQYIVTLLLVSGTIYLPSSLVYQHVKWTDISLFLNFRAEASL